MSNNREIAKSWFEANREPIQALCPVITQYWETKDGQMTWNSRDCVRSLRNRGEKLGKRYDTDENYVSVRSEYYGFYVRYVEEIDALEFAGVWLKGNRGKDGEQKQWAYSHDKYYYRTMGSRLLIFKGDTNGYLANGSVYAGGKYYSKEVCSFIRSMNSYAITKENFNELQKFVPTAKFESRWTIYRAYPWLYSNWYQRNFMSRTVSAKAKKLNEYELEDVTLTPKTDLGTVAYFQKLDDKYGVLRIFVYGSNYSGCDYTYHHQRYTRINDEATEVYRVFISNTGKVSMLQNVSDSWILKADSGWYQHREVEFLNTEEMLKWNPIKYVYTTLNNFTLQELINVLRHPIVEQLIKANYPNMAKFISREDCIARNLKEYFMVEKEKKLPLYKLLGINKYTLQQCELSLTNNEGYTWRWSSRINAIKEAKRLYNRFDISDLSEQTINTIFTMFGETSVSEYLPGGSGYWWHRWNVELTNDEREFIFRLMRLNEQNGEMARLFKDTIGVYNRLIDRPDIDLTAFDGYQDLRRLHDELIALNEQQEANRRAAYDAAKKKELEQLSKQFDELQDDRVAKFEYENDEFCIRMPKTLQEITDEGLRLHHCVGGYVTRHAMGTTNIIFLRKKGEEEQSFYTIEITPSNTVVQIHGNHNRWLGNNPEAVPFVYTWLEKIGAKYDKEMLLNKGLGYGAGLENLGEEYLKLIA